MKYSALLLALALFAAPAGAAPKLDLVALDASGLAAGEIGRLTADRAVVRYLEFGDRFVLACPAGQRPALPFAARLPGLPVEPSLGEPFLATRRGADSPLDAVREQIFVVFEQGPWTLFQAPPEILQKLEKEQSNHFRLEPFDRTIRLLVPAGRVSGALKDRPATTVPVSLERLKKTVATLADFKTRGSTTAGYENSANWCAAEFRKLGYEAAFHEYNDYGRIQRNVVAQSKGASGPFYLVEGHLDSTSPEVETLAPGADDNASGSAGVLEVATLLAKHPKAAKVRFLLVAGEELGLRGSTAYVKELQKTGEIKNLLGVVNFDMISWDREPPLSTLIETREFSNPFLAPFLEEAKAGGLKTTVSYNPWGSDHVPFLRANVPTFLFIEDEFETNTNYHQVSDLPKDCNFALATDMVRVVTAVLTALIERK